MHHRMTKGLRSGMSSKKSFEGIEHSNFAKSSSSQKDTAIPPKKNFSRSYVPTKAKSTARGLAIHSKERVCIVDSSASLHVMGSFL